MLDTPSVDIDTSPVMFAADEAVADEARRKPVAEDDDIREFFERGLDATYQHASSRPRLEDESETEESVPVRIPETEDEIAAFFNGVL
jgi:hypothetical protein